MADNGSKTGRNWYVWLLVGLAVLLALGVFIFPAWWPWSH